MAWFMTSSILRRCGFSTLSAELTYIRLMRGTFRALLGASCLDDVCGDNSRQLGSNTRWKAVSITFNRGLRGALQFIAGQKDI